MREINTDILIVGGGLSGLLAALSLSQCGLETSIIEKQKFLSSPNTLVDYRTTAISEGSKKFLQEIGLWKNIKKYAIPISTIKVHNRGRNSEINFVNQDKLNFLGYVVRNSILKKELIKEINKFKNIKMYEGEVLNKISPDRNTSIIETTIRIFKTKLVIAADGKFSSVRSIMRTPVYTKDYKHNALVVNFSHEKNHNNIAYEVFYNTGPLAILPMMSTSKKNFSSSMIWSHTKEYSDALNELDENIRKEIIQEKILRYSGNLIKIFDVKKFNLSAHLNSKFFEKRLVYIGDAAHSIHPIAGQGWNLGVRDIKKLLLVINKNLNLGLDIGTEEVCSSYNNLAYNDAYSLFQITDKLNYIFLNESNMAKVLRKVGFKAIEKNLKLKNFISNYAMGI